MAEKSSGDTSGRKMKNPLLCSTVTGLSIDDFIQNAVLLPALPPERPAEPDDDDQNRPPRLLSATTVRNHAQIEPSTFTTYRSTAQPSKTNELNSNLDEIDLNTKDKEDDFDIDSFYSRLHTTPNLNNEKPKEAIEEFSEIDLLSTSADSRVFEEKENLSMAADFAQNLSQLPNVLPHVANTVFNSFSSIWNMNRSRTEEARGPANTELNAGRNVEIFEVDRAKIGEELRLGEDRHDGAVEPVPLFDTTSFSGVGERKSNIHVTKEYAVSRDVFDGRADDALKEMDKGVTSPGAAISSDFGAANKYRLGSKKKKTYAHVPGLVLGETEYQYQKPQLPVSGIPPLPSSALRSNSAYNHNQSFMLNPSIFPSCSVEFTPLTDSASSADISHQNVIDFSGDFHNLKKDMGNSTLQPFVVESNLTNRFQVDSVLTASNNANIVLADEHVTEYKHNINKSEIDICRVVEKPTGGNILVEKPIEENIVVEKPTNENIVVGKLTKENIVIGKPNEGNIVNLPIYASDNKLSDVLSDVRDKQKVQINAVDQHLQSKHNVSNLIFLDPQACSNVTTVPTSHLPPQGNAYRPSNGAYGQKSNLSVKNFYSLLKKNSALTGTNQGTNTNAVHNLNHPYNVTASSDVQPVAIFNPVNFEPSEEGTFVANSSLYQPQPHISSVSFDQNVVNQLTESADTSSSTPGFVPPLLLSPESRRETSKINLIPHTPVVSIECTQVSAAQDVDIQQPMIYNPLTQSQSQSLPQGVTNSITSASGPQSRENPSASNISKPFSNVTFPVGSPLALAPPVAAPSSFSNATESGNRFRLSNNKKRLQYYSGPVDSSAPMQNSSTPVQTVAFQRLPESQPSVSILTPSNENTLSNLQSNYAPLPNAYANNSSTHFTPGLSSSDDHLTSLNPQYDSSLSRAPKLQESNDSSFKIPSTFLGFTALGSIQKKVNLNNIQKAVTSFFDANYYEQKEKEDEQFKASHGNSEQNDSIVYGSHLQDSFVQSFEYDPNQAAPHFYNTSQFDQQYAGHYSEIQNQNFENANEVLKIKSAQQTTNDFHEKPVQSVVTTPHFYNPNQFVQQGHCSKIGNQNSDNANEDLKIQSAQQTTNDFLEKAVQSVMTTPHFYNLNQFVQQGQYSEIGNQNNNNANEDLTIQSFQQTTNDSHEKPAQSVMTTPHFYNPNQFDLQGHYSEMGNQNSNNANQDLNIQSAQQSTNDFNDKPVQSAVTTPHFYNPNQCDQQGHYSDIEIQNSNNTNADLKIQSAQLTTNDFHEKAVQSVVTTPHFYNPNQFDQHFSEMGNQNSKNDNEDLKIQSAQQSTNDFYEKPIQSVLTTPHFYNPNQIDQQGQYSEIGIQNSNNVNEDLKIQSAQQSINDSHEKPVQSVMTTPQFYNPNQFDQHSSEMGNQNSKNDNEDLKIQSTQQTTNDFHEKAAQSVVTTPHFYNPNQFDQQGQYSEIGIQNSNNVNEDLKIQSAQQSTNDSHEKPVQSVMITPQFYNPNQFDQHSSEMGNQKSKNDNEDLKIQSAQQTINDYCEKSIQSESASNQSQYISDVKTSIPSDLAQGVPKARLQPIVLPPAINFFDNFTGSPFNDNIVTNDNVNADKWTNTVFDEINNCGNTISFESDVRRKSMSPRTASYESDPFFLDGPQRKVYKNCVMTNAEKGEMKNDGNASVETLESSTSVIGLPYPEGNTHSEEEYTSRGTIETVEDDTLEEHSAHQTGLQRSDKLDLYLGEDNSFAGYGSVDLWSQRNNGVEDRLSNSSNLVDINMNRQSVEDGVKNDMKTVAGTGSDVATPEFAPHPDENINFVSRPPHITLNNSDDEEENYYGKENRPVIDPTFSNHPRSMVSRNALDRDRIDLKVENFHLSLDSQFGPSYPRPNVYGDQGGQDCNDPSIGQRLLEHIRHEAEHLNLGEKNAGEDGSNKAFEEQFLIEMLSREAPEKTPGVRRDETDERQLLEQLRCDRIKSKAANQLFDGLNSEENNNKTEEDMVQSIPEDLLVTRETGQLDQLIGTFNNIIVKEVKRITPSRDLASHKKSPMYTIEPIGVDREDEDHVYENVSIDGVEPGRQVSTFNSYFPESQFDISASFSNDRFHKSVLNRECPLSLDQQLAAFVPIRTVSPRTSASGFSTASVPSADDAMGQSFSEQQAMYDYPKTWADERNTDSFGVPLAYIQQQLPYNPAGANLVSGLHEMYSTSLPSSSQDDRFLSQNLEYQQNISVSLQVVRGRSKSPSSDNDEGSFLKVRAEEVFLPKDIQNKNENINTALFMRPPVAIPSDSNDVESVVDNDLIEEEKHIFTERNFANDCVNDVIEENDDSNNGNDSDAFKEVQAEDVQQIGTIDKALVRLINDEIEKGAENIGSSTNVMCHDTVSAVDESAEQCFGEELKEDNVEISIERQKENDNFANNSCAASFENTFGKDYGDAWNDTQGSTEDSCSRTASDTGTLEAPGSPKVSNVDSEINLFKNTDKDDNNLDSDNNLLDPEQPNDTAGVPQVLDFSSSISSIDISSKNKSEQNSVPLFNAFSFGFDNQQSFFNDFGGDSDKKSKNLRIASSKRHDDNLAQNFHTKKDDTRPVGVAQPYQYNSQSQSSSQTTNQTINHTSASTNVTNTTYFYPIAVSNHPSFANEQNYLYRNVQYQNQAIQPEFYMVRQPIISNQFQAQPQGQFLHYQEQPLQGSNRAAAQSNYIQNLPYNSNPIPPVYNQIPENSNQIQRNNNFSFPNVSDAKNCQQYFN